MISELAEGGREARRRAFLAQARFGGARRETLAGDASTRRYERLHPRGGGASVILMDQQPAAEARPCPPDASPAERAALGYNALARLAAGRVDAFAAIAGWLREQGLSAPAVLAADFDQGFALLEDLGDTLFARAIAGGQDEGALYRAATEVLVCLHQAPAPAELVGFGVRWPLLDYDEIALRTGGDLLVEWLPRLAPTLRLDDRATNEWREAWAPIIARGAAGASVFCHRDFHAENLLWLTDRVGPARVGLLDFQDAVRAHPAWDLSMLLHDARREVSPALEAASLAHYLRLRPEADGEALIADFHALGALNIVRILGLFARLVVRDSKPRYRALMPRLWRYLDRCLADPALVDLASWFDRHVSRDSRT